MKTSIPNLYDVLSELNECFDNDTDNEFLFKNHSTNAINQPPYTLFEFYNFLKRTHCEENLEFFKKTRKFLLNKNASDQSRFDIDCWNKSIYHNFIEIDSPMECNFPQHIREIFENCFNSKVPPKQTDIVQAIQHILGLLFDAYSRFLNKISEDIQYIELQSDQTNKYTKESLDVCSKNSSSDNSISLTFNKFNLDLNDDDDDWRLISTSAKLTTFDDLPDFITPIFTQCANYKEIEDNNNIPNDINTKTKNHSRKRSSVHSKNEKNNRSLNSKKGQDNLFEKSRRFLNKFKFKDNKKSQKIMDSTNTLNKKYTNSHKHSHSTLTAKR